MQGVSTESFRALKSAVVKQLAQQRPGLPPDPMNWRRADIEALQEDLAEKVQGRVSEKWFYTHFKQEQERLPRIDMLDMLSTYVGAESWREFVGKKTAPSASSPSGTPKRSFPVSWAWLGLLFLPLLAWGAMQWTTDNPERTYCFVDRLTLTPIPDSLLEVYLLRQGESPLRLRSDAQGCIQVQVKDTLKLAIQARYYHPDTLIRTQRSAIAEIETIPLKPDDFARMIHYYAHNRVEDWTNRRAQLMEGFAPEARIFQLQASDMRGMRLFTREEFVDRLSLPLPGMKRLEVLETNYEEGKITRLTFIQLP